MPPGSYIGEHNFDVYVDVAGLEFDAVAEGWATDCSADAAAPLPVVDRRKGPSRPPTEVL